MNLDPNLGTDYQVNRQRLGHPDSAEARKPPTFAELGGDPAAQRRSVHPALALLVWVLGLGALALSVALYFWAGLVLSFLVGIVACVLIGAAISATRSQRITTGWVSDPPTRSSPQALALSVRLCELVGLTPPEDELAYLNVAEVARAVCERSVTDATSLQPLFALAEEVLQTGEMELRTLIAVGLFEDLQNFLRRGPGSQETIIAMLGARSKRAWDGVEAFWQGDVNAIKRALADQ
jgi:hypothetical protein